MYSRLQELKEVKNIDLLFLGSSHAYRGFDTRIFADSGYTSFNLGSSSQTPIQTKILVERYIDQLKPKLVIYEVYPGTLCSDGLESSLDIIANSKNDQKSIALALKTDHVKAYNTLLYASMRQALGLDDDFKEPAIKEEDTYITGGYVERKLECFEHKKYDHPKYWAFNHDQLHILEEIIQIFEDKNIDFLLVYAPVTPNLYNAYQNNNAFDQLMNTTGHYVNFNPLVNLDDSLHFYDSHHLNQHGVTLFNTKVIELVNHRFHKH